jgi:hypothetical protein
MKAEISVKEKTLYGIGGTPHHIFCNFSRTNGECRQCERLYKTHPVNEERPNNANEPS